MALPASWTQINVTATYLNRDTGEPARGTVVFTAPHPVLVDGITVVPKSIVATLDVNGQISVWLPASVDEHVNPTGWRWHVVEKVKGLGRGDFYLEVDAVDDAAGINLGERAPLGYTDDGNPIVMGELVEHTHPISEVTGLQAELDTIDDDLAVIQGDVADLEAALAGKASTGHNHDDRYYTESETNALLDTKADDGHVHSADDVTSGTLAAARIPGLDATKIITGELDAARIPNLDANKIGGGTLATARLGSGTPDATTFLRGDQTWAVPAGGGGGGTPDPHALSHADGGTDEVSLDASQIVSGTLAAARIPLGTTGTTAAYGNHGHATYVESGASTIGVGLSTSMNDPSWPDRSAISDGDVWLGGSATGSTEITFSLRLTSGLSISDQLTAVTARRGYVDFYRPWTGGTWFGLRYRITGDASSSGAAYTTVPVEYIGHLGSSGASNGSGSHYIFFPSLPYEVGPYPSSFGQAATKLPQTDGSGGWTFIDPPSGGGGGGAPLIGFTSTATWRTPWGQGNEASEHNNQYLQLAPVILGEDVTLTGLSILQRNPAAASAVVRIAVYAHNAAANSPGALMKATSALAADVTDTFVTESFTGVSLPAGIYWAGAVYNSGAGRGTVSLATRYLVDPWAIAQNGTGATPNANLGNDGYTWELSGVSGAPPDPIGGGQAVTNSNGNNRPAQVWWKVAAA